MLLNKTNIKNKSIQMLLPIEVLNNVSLANKFIWKPENTEILRQIVKLEEGRLAYFKDSPITSIMDLMEYSESVYDMLSDWDKDFLSDMLDRNMYSIKQKALLLRICSSVNYAMWKNKIPKETLKKKEKEDMFTVKEIRNKSYNVDNVKEEELTDETELIEKFEILKNNFDDIMESNLFDHQVISVNFLMTRENGSGIIGSSTGLGKTVVATTYSEQLFSEGKINHTYVIAPLAMVETWKREIVKHTKAKDLSRYTIINYEKLLSLKLSNTEQSLVVLDEAHRLKNNLSKRYKAFKKYTWKYIVPMSATIIGNKLDELRNIYELINKKAPVRQGNVDLTQLKKDLIRVPKSKLNLPPLTIKEIPIELNNLEEYKKIEDDIITEIKKEKRPSNQLVKLLRLNQYCSNKNIITEHKLKIEEQNKFKVVLDILDDLDNDKQVIIWSNFVDTIKNLKDLLSDYYSVEFIDGSVKQDKRDKILDDFRANKFKVLVSNPNTLSTGITLINASNMIYFDRDYSSIKFIQAIGRFFRIGQDKQCTLYNLFYEDTIEEVIIDVLKKKEEMINNILENGSSTEDIKISDIINRIK